jgi:hypothetical protein
MVEKIRTKNPNSDNLLKICFEKVKSHSIGLVLHILISQSYADSDQLY